MNSKTSNSAAWSLVGLTGILAVTAWVQSFSGPVTFTGYTIFPLLGLVAFSIMWTHYVVGALRRYYGVSKKDLHSYFTASSLIALFCILMHPGLLILSLWKDGQGLPPNSYLENYVPQTGKFAVMLGSISLVIFLFFELKRKFGHHKWWRLVEYAQVLAMIAIFVHALQLGGELDILWYRAIWFFYGITFVLCAGYNYFIDLRKGSS